MWIVDINAFRNIEVKNAKTSQVKAKVQYVVLDEAYLLITMDRRMSSNTKGKNVKNDNDTPELCWRMLMSLDPTRQVHYLDKIAKTDIYVFGNVTCLSLQENCIYLGR